jgi:Transglutaminase-like superfamily
MNSSNLIVTAYGSVLCKMTRWRKFLRLPVHDQRFLLESAALLASIRVGLRLLPFETLRRLLTRIPYRAPRRLQVEDGAIGRIVDAVDVLSRHFPILATCLTQALTTQVLLRRHGYPAELRIGVAHGSGGQLQAHAWVESEGRIVSGGVEDLSRYTPLPSLDRKIR